MVVSLHLVVEDLSFLRCGVGDQLGLNYLQNIVADVRQFCLDLGLVILDERKLLGLPASVPRGDKGAPREDSRQPEIRCTKRLLPKDHPKSKHPEAVR